jgi:hypothetical protein
MAQQRISPEFTVKSFRKCCISNAVDGTEDDMLWNDSEEDGEVRSECEEDEDSDSDTDW